MCSFKNRFSFANFFHCNNYNNVSTKEMFVEELLLDSCLNVLTTDMVDNMKSAIKIYIKGA